MKLRIDALLLLVATSGYVATSGIRIDVVRLSLLILAGFLGAAGASATNHYLDRDLDSVMMRTRARPLPQHRIQPPAHALEFGLALVFAGLVIAGVGINLLTAAMIGLGFVVYIGVYTLGLKRSHVSNIVIGGFAGSSGPRRLRGGRERDQPPRGPHRPPRVPLDPGTLLGPRVPEPRGLPARGPPDAPRGLGRPNPGPRNHDI